MTATTPRPGHHDKDDVVLVPFAKEHLEGALRLSQEMSWPYRLEDWAIEDWPESIGLPQVGDATTMVSGTQTPSTGPARVFALANQSFN